MLVGGSVDAHIQCFNSDRDVHLHGSQGVEADWNLGATAERPVCLLRFKFGSVGVQAIKVEKSYSAGSLEKITTRLFRIHVKSSPSHFSIWHYGALQIAITTIIVLLSLPQTLTYLVSIYLCGHLSNIYNDIINQPIDIRFQSGKTISQLLGTSFLFEQLADQPKTEGQLSEGLSRTAMVQRMKKALKHEKGLTNDEIECLVGIGLQHMLKVVRELSNELEAERAANEGIICTEAYCHMLGNENLGVKNIVKLYDVDRKPHLLEKLFTPSEISDQLSATLKIRSTRRPQNLGREGSEQTSVGWCDDMTSPEVWPVAASDLRCNSYESSDQSLKSPGTNDRETNLAEPVRLGVSPRYRSTKKNDWLIPFSDLQDRAAMTDPCTQHRTAHTIQQTSIGWSGEMAGPSPDLRQAMVPDLRGKSHDASCETFESHRTNDNRNNVVEAALAPSERSAKKKKWSVGDSNLQNTAGFTVPSTQGPQPLNGEIVERTSGGQPADMAAESAEVQPVATPHLRAKSHDWSHGTNDKSCAPEMVSASVSPRRRTTKKKKWSMGDLDLQATAALVAQSDRGSQHLNGEAVKQTSIGWSGDTADAASRMQPIGAEDLRGTVARLG
eukprot:TRINITY_DN89203_c0_g1_i1.p1 TRINITY_DN89203_c0_g1~~TRINITY_DN89203_c0_g1_i1.p1  ORF type:complete len:649 (-),score=73.84 TRINITY_DN89203_c0_g1_i1:613-2448(-)